MKQSGAMTLDPKDVHTIRQIELDIIQMVVDFGRIIGLPRSVCEIYGLLISALQPVAMEEICSRLSLSLGSVSQGLKLLNRITSYNVCYTKLLR